MALDVSTERHGSMVQVSLSGELDAHTASAVGDVVRPALASGVTDVHVNAEHLEFMDSSGISELLRIQRWVADNGGSFRIQGAGSTVRRVLEITGLLEILGVQ